MPLDVDAKNTPEVVQQLPRPSRYRGDHGIRPINRAAHQAGARLARRAAVRSVDRQLQSLVAALGDDARGLVFTSLIPNPWKATGLAGEFSAQMSKANIPIDHDHFFGYLNMRVLIEGLKRAGRAVTPKSLVASMERMGMVDFGGYTVSYSPTKHHGTN